METEDEGKLNRLEKDLTEKVALAAKVATAAPDFKNQALDKVLDFLLRQGGGGVAGLPGPGARASKPASRRAPATPAEALTRVRSILDSPAEVVSRNAEIFNFDAKGKIYKLLAIARDEFQIDGLTTAEIRALANEKFRLGVPDGTLRGTLSKAPPAELGRTSSANGDTYKLFRAGDEYLKRQQASGSGPSGEHEDGKVS